MKARENCDTYFAFQNVWVIAMDPETQQRSPAKTRMSRGKRTRNGAISINKDWIMVSMDKAKSFVFKLSIVLMMHFC